MVHIDKFSVIYSIGFNGALKLENLLVLQIARKNLTLSKYISDKIIGPENALLAKQLYSMLSCLGKLFTKLGRPLYSYFMLYYFLISY